MEQANPLDALFELAERHRVTMAAICERAGIDPTTPSRWRRGKNGPTMDRLNRLNSALAAIIAETDIAAVENAPTEDVAA